jgi:hypothetical protein
MQHGYFCSWSGEGPLCRSAQWRLVFLFVRKWHVASARREVLRSQSSYQSKLGLRMSSCSDFYSRRGIQWVVVSLLALVLLDCAGRPGPEVLTPVAASPGAKTLQIYVATTRERENSSGNVFTANRANALNFAGFVVSVPPNHKSGDIEMSTNPPDPQSSFAIVDQAVMSEAEFRKAVASQSDTGRKKHKAFVFGTWV